MQDTAVHCRAAGTRWGTIGPTSGGLIAHIKAWRIFYIAYRHPLHIFEQTTTVIPMFYVFKTTLE